MIITSLSVGAKYSKKYSKNLKRFLPTNIKVYILTDFPHLFDFCNPIKYTRDVFSYFEKITFSLKLSMDLKEDVLYTDIDYFHSIDESIFSKKIQTNSFLYEKIWPDYPYSYLETLPPALLDYYKIKEKIKIENIHERIFYIPYSDKIENLYNDLIQIKDIWEMESIEKLKTGKALVKYSKIGIGYGEGIPFSLALEYNNVKKEKYNFTKKTII